MLALLGGTRSGDAIEKRGGCHFRSLKGRFYEKVKLTGGNKNEIQLREVLEEEHGKHGSSDEREIGTS